MIKIRILSTGKHCEEEVDECHNRIDACNHHGECKNSVGSFSCNCSTGWSGKVCDIDVDECASKPCQNAKYSDAKCINTPGSYSCKCPFGWEGKHCEKGKNILNQPCYLRDIAGLKAKPKISTFALYWLLFLGCIKFCRMRYFAKSQPIFCGILKNLF